MAFGVLQTVDIIEIMENYMAKVRPEPEIRDRLDVSYTMEKQSIILNEVRPFFEDPSRIMVLGYAKTTYVSRTKRWKVYWKRSDLKWHLYEPAPEVASLQDFLNLVDEDRYHCFNG